MASLHYSKRDARWRVIVFLGRDEQRRVKTKTKTFRTEAEARQYMAENGLVIGRHRTARTVDEVIAHLAANSAYDPESGCVVWQATITPDGYGIMHWAPPSLGYKVSGAHRISHHVLVAEVPRDRVIDHLCRNRACIRPDHLEVVTGRENVMRSPITLAYKNASKTHCPQGHEYTPENTYVHLPRPGRMTTGRLCITCNKAAGRRTYERRRAQKAATS